MEQATAYETGKRDTRWRPGQSGNPAGARSRKQRHAEMLARLAADCGGVEALSPGDCVLLDRAVDLLLLRPTTQDDGVRLLNAATRIIENIRRRHRARRRGPIGKGLRAYLDSGEAA
jgi:hypothetical protein